MTECDIRAMILCRLISSFNKYVLRERERAIVKNRLKLRPERAVVKAILELVESSIDQKEVKKRGLDAPNEIYGTISFETVCAMIDELSPIAKETKFTDLGSGVGQVVLAMAAMVDCALCTGVEKVPARAEQAAAMGERFKELMTWLGKTFSPFVLLEGDFLSPEMRDTISQSSVIFTNNFVFGPAINEELKRIFTTDLTNGSYVVSMEKFCPLNFRVNQRNVSSPEAM